MSFSINFDGIWFSLKTGNGGWQVLSGWMDNGINEAEEQYEKVLEYGLDTFHVYTEQKELSEEELGKERIEKAVMAHAFLAMAYGKKMEHVKRDMSDRKFRDLIGVVMLCVRGRTRAYCVYILIKKTYT